MKLLEIFRFEFTIQAHRIRTWLYFAVLFVVAFLLSSNLIEDARNGSTLANSPSVIAFITGITNLLWVLMATDVTGSAAARDPQAMMHPLIYTSPISKFDYLAGRFSAAFILNALMFLMVPAGMLFAALKPGIEPGILGPFRPVAYLSSYVFIGLSTAFVTTAIQFSLSTRNRRAVASYVAGILLCFFCFAAGAAANVLHLPTLGKLIDPIHFISNGIIANTLTPIEKNTRLIALDRSVLLSDVIWVGIAIGVLVFTYLHFGFRHYTPSGSNRKFAHSNVSDDAQSWPTQLTPGRNFGMVTRVSQACTIAWSSFIAIVRSGAGLVLLIPIAIGVALLIPLVLEVGGVPLLPTTSHVITVITAPIANNLRFPSVLVPLIIIFYAGELVWRERDARLDQIASTVPVPEWITSLGKFLGLGLVLFAWMMLLMSAGMLGQIIMGYFDFEIGVYFRVLFGIQLIDWLLFAALVFTVHVVVNQKQLGYLLSLLAFGLIACASRLGIEHKLLVYTSDPGWRYSDTRGFGTSLGPWLWFKTYWLAWALLFAVVVKLFWVGGLERGVMSRLHEVRRRFTRGTVAMTVIALSLILSTGGYIFYNTNILNDYETTADRKLRDVEYEHRYKKYEGIAQPSLTSTRLRIGIYPERAAAKITGTHVLTNKTSVEINSIHVATTRGVETSAISIDGAVQPVVSDDRLGYYIYSMQKPLLPGDSLQLNFEVHIAPHGFRNNGVDSWIVSNGSYFMNQECMPAIGYQRDRELSDAEDRKQYGLPVRPVAPPLDDAVARHIRVGGEPIAFEAVISTNAGQVAVAPGALHRTWTEGDRRYFHYITDAPINNEYSVFSAGYALHEEQWIPSAGSGPAVNIQIFHDPRHDGNLARMVRSVRASLSYHTARFGPYPHNYIKLIEHPALGMGVQTEAATIEYGERFSSISPGDGPRDLYIVFAVLAHAVAREWWGMQVVPADVEGAGLLTQSLETYSAMRVVEDTLGTEVLERYIISMREAYSTPHTRAAPPLIRATDSFAFSRKGPFALYAMREYIGKERVDDALRHLFGEHRSGTPLATSIDLYNELKDVTPDSLQYLLQDLFGKNTFWEFETEQTYAQQTAAGSWQVTLDVRARKIVVDEMGAETEVPMNDWIEIGISGESESYNQKHIVRSGLQTITVTVPYIPQRAGIDPRHLLSERGEVDRNSKTVKIVE